MKDSKTYGGKIVKLFRSLRQKHPKVRKIEYDSPTDALIYAIVSEHVRASTAKTIAGKVGKHFVDLNDLRVSRTEEILDILGQPNIICRQIASTLTEVLNSIYNKYNMVDLTALKETGKRQARKKLEKLNGLSKFAANYCFLTALEGHCIPLTQKMIGYLRAGELVHPGATDEDIEGFLERQISAADAYEFYSLLRRESEKTTRRASKKTSKKAAKRKASKKKKKTTKTKKS